MWVNSIILYKVALGYNRKKKKSNRTTKRAQTSFAMRSFMFRLKKKIKKKKSFIRKLKCVLCYVRDSSYLPLQHP